MLLISGLCGRFFGEWESLIVIPDFTKVDTVSSLMVSALFTFGYIKVRYNKRKNAISTSTNQNTIELDVFMQPKYTEFQRDKALFSQYSPKSFYLEFIVCLVSIIILGMIIDYYM